MSLFSSIFQRKLKMRPCAAVIVAAGNASRMGGIDKVMAMLGLEPMIVHTVRAFQENEFVTEIVIVTREDLLAEVARLCREANLNKVKCVVVGGASRTESVLAGLNAVSGEMQVVAIHDAARPLVPQQVIKDAILKGTDTGAAAPAIAVKDTIKQAESGVVTATPERSSLFAVQTPQVFDLDFIKGALYQAGKDGAALTDDCMAAERLGMKVHLTQGSEENFKVTTPIDLMLANAVLDAREGIV